MNQFDLTFSAEITSDYEKKVLQDWIEDLSINFNLSDVKELINHDMWIHYGVEKHDYLVSSVDGKLLIERLDKTKKL